MSGPAAKRHPKGPPAEPPEGKRAKKADGVAAANEKRKEGA
jgi:hypothetical protein